MEDEPMGRPEDGPRDPGPIAGEEAERWRDALRAALSGPALRRSARGRELLSYLVGETLAGRRERITGTTIAQDVLGRDASFDGEGDAIVRVQMRRLRVQLGEDHGAEALGDAPRIVVPKGAYRPELRDPPAAGAEPPEAEGALGFAEAPAPPLAPPPQEANPEEKPEEGPKEARGPRRDRLLLGGLAVVLMGLLAFLAGDVADLLAGGPDPAAIALDDPPLATSAEVDLEAIADYPIVGVLPFNNFTGDPSNDVFETGLQLQLASDLQRFGVIRATALEARPEAGDPSPARYLVGGTLLDIEDTADVFVFLTDVEAGYSVLSRRIREPEASAGEPGDYYTTLQRISLAVTGRIAGGQGEIERAETARIAPGQGIEGEAGLEAFRCVALAQSFLRTRTVDDHRRASSCISQRLAYDPQEAVLTAYRAMLAFYALPEMGLMDTRALTAATSDVEAIRTLARRAVSMDPGSDVAHAIRGSILNALGERREAIASLNRAVDLNPGNPTIHALLGLALAGEERWEEAEISAQTAIAISAEPQPFYYVPAFLGALMEDDVGTAIAAAAEVGRTTAPWAATVQLVGAQLAGETAQVERLRPHVKEYADRHRGDALAGLRRFVPSDAAMAEMEERLSAAGL
jgi:tetratricopeptide (TPR) repeat protein